VWVFVVKPFLDPLEVSEDPGDYIDHHNKASKRKWLGQKLPMYF